MTAAELAAPVAAPAAGNAIEIAFGTAQAQTERPRDGDDMRNWHWFKRGWNAARAARPAAVTEEMVEAAASAYFGVDNWKSFPTPTVTSYREAWRSALTAALAAGGARA